MTSPRSRTFTIAASGLAVFLVCFLVFALQARSAREHAALAAVPASAAPRPVLQRRVIVRRVVVHVRPAREADDGGAATPARTVVTTSAPPATSAPAPAPAPAPATPPLVTRTS